MERYMKKVLIAFLLALVAASAVAATTANLTLSGRIPPKCWVGIDGRKECNFKNVSFAIEGSEEITTFTAE
jgi:type 1 fimbria pilin